MNEEVYLSHQVWECYEKTKEKVSSVSALRKHFFKVVTENLEQVEAIFDENKDELLQGEALKNMPKLGSFGDNVTICFVDGSELPSFFFWTATLTSINTLTDGSWIEEGLEVIIW